MDKESKKLCCFNYELVNQGMAMSTGYWSVQESFNDIKLYQDMLDNDARPLSSPADCNRASTPPASPQDIKLLLQKQPSSSLFPQSSSSPESEKGIVNGEGEKEMTSSKESVGGRSRRGCSSSGKRNKKSPKQSQDAILVTPPKLKVAEEDLGMGEVSDLPIGMMAVTISAYISPSDFNIQLEENQALLTELMGDLMLYENSTLCLRDWKPGEYCAAKSSHDHKWYHGQVLQYKEESELYSVKLVDDGLEEDMDHKQLRALRSIHTKTPVLLKVR